MEFNYKLYQIKNPSNCAYAFRKYDYAKEHNFSLDDYELVYSKEDIEPKTKYDEELLTILFKRLNTVNPEGYSLSISDVVELNGKFYYCETSEWKQLDL